MMKRTRNLAILMVTAVVLCACGVNGSRAVTPEQVEAIAREAYVWGFPMVMNYKTLYNYVIDTSNPEYKGPFNQVSCVARLFTPEDRAVVTPNGPNGCNIKGVIGMRYRDGSWGSPPPQPICRTATRGR